MGSKTGSPTAREWLDWGSKHSAALGPGVHKEGGPTAFWHRYSRYHFTLNISILRGLFPSLAQYSSHAICAYRIGRYKIRTIGPRLQTTQKPDGTHYKIQTGPTTILLLWTFRLNRVTIRCHRFKMWTEPLLFHFTSPCNNNRNNINWLPTTFKLCSILFTLNDQLKID